MITRVQVVEHARTWIGTPFHHAARVKGVGVDCAGVPIGVSRELGTVPADFDVPPYTMTPDGHTMLEWCNANLRRVEQAQMQPGDMIITIVDKDPQHIGILGNWNHGGLSIIHSCNSRSCVPPRVIETRLMFSRRLRFVAAYALPGVV